MTLQSIGELISQADVEEGVWIGLHDQHVEASCDETGFIWTDGTPTDYENWARGEPNDWQEGQARCDPEAVVEGGEDCVEQYVQSMEWNDVSCDAERAYICVRDC